MSTPKNSTPRRLAGRRILVVGGGQQSGGLEDPPVGNGRAMAIVFAREGASVAVADADPDAAQETVDAVRGEGGEAMALVADASDERDVVAMIDETERTLRGLTGWS